MSTPHGHRVMPPNGHRRRRAFTLAELVVSMTIFTVLAGAMTSIVLVASRALPTGKDPLDKKTQAADLVERIAGDLVYATSIINSDAEAVSFTVSDRGHGAAGPETIGYDWSGTPGDPLQHAYNGVAGITVCEDVHDFSLEYTWKAKPLTHSPRVLLVVDDDASPNAQDLAKQAVIESFGFSVQMIAALKSAAEFSPLIAANDVMYISNQIDRNDILDKSLDLAMGIITEKRLLYVDLRFAAFVDWDTLDAVHVIDNTHEITSPFAIGELTVCDSLQGLSYFTRNDHAPGLQVLADWDGWPELAVLDVGAEQYGGGTAKGRRVKLPWGGMNVFDTNSLNSNGETITRRSIVWAAARVGVASVRITLQVGSNLSGRVDTQVQLLNLPEVQ